MSQDKKVCKLVKDEAIQKTDSQKFKKIVQDAKYFCKKCGHVACSQQQICKPENLE
ncbi:MAG: hypothetical protein JEZ07_14330 [Phycisphaerae bacterium]|nr:hypothetical protein [Phycisphaerae bacterium]